MRGFLSAAPDGNILHRQLPLTLPEPGMEKQRRAENMQDCRGILTHAHTKFTHEHPSEHILSTYKPPGTWSKSSEMCIEMNQRPCTWACAASDTRCSAPDQAHAQAHTHGQPHSGTQSPETQRRSNIREKVYRQAQPSGPLTQTAAGTAAGCSGGSDVSECTLASQCGEEAGEREETALGWEQKTCGCMSWGEK